MAGAAATGQRDAVGTEKFSGDFQNVKAAAAFAGGFRAGIGFSLRVHALAKLSASATALRMAMDLLTVSWNSPSGVESFTQPPPACT